MKSNMAMRAVVRRAGVRDIEPHQHRAGGYSQQTAYAPLLAMALVACWLAGALVIALVIALLATRKSAALVA